MSLWKNKPLKPMLLKEVEKPFNDKDYIFEIKFDGIRAIVYANKKTINIYSRNGKEITHLYPELENIKEIVSKNTIFDGEIVLFENNKPSFSKLLERNNTKKKNKIKSYQQNYPVNFMCFDILYEGKDLNELPLLERKQILSKYKDNDHFNKTFFIEEKGINLFKEIKKLNLEGIVAKKKDSIYEIGVRTYNWLKIKNIKQEEFYIGGYTINKNNLSLYLGELKDNRLNYVGKVALAKKYKLSQDILKSKKLKLSTFNSEIDEDIIYIKPDYKVNVSYLEKNNNGHLRHPVIDNNRLI